MFARAHHGDPFGEQHYIRARNRLANHGKKFIYALLGRVRFTRPQIDGSHAYGTGSRRCDLLERNVIPPDGGVGRVLQMKLQLDGSSGLRRRCIQRNTRPLSGPFAGVNIVRLSGTRSVRLGPVEPRDHLPPLVLDALRAIVSDKAIPLPRLDPRSRVFPSTVLGGIGVTGNGERSRRVAVMHQIDESTR